MSRADHMDVAAYALGVLDEQDTERFEEHLATCWACAAELETMVPVVGLLSDIDGETMMAMEHTATTRPCWTVPSSRSAPTGVAPSSGGSSPPPPRWWRSAR
ncbi:zf-HC2 domain-containing protein [Micromonospora sp. 4G55]|uniref:zf-HC2 domain-containing protein n=1 Tax=Micromonospora sp. 4G55 TaxID=2806102 RepID=UPI001EE3BB12|nr:zf-HC2 domain-containing protein [Micromonospora sp. 4G55]